MRAVSMATFQEKWLNKTVLLKHSREKTDQRLKEFQGWWIFSLAVLNKLVPSALSSVYSKVLSEDHVEG